MAARKQAAGSAPPRRTRKRASGGDAKPRTASNASGRRAAPRARVHGGNGDRDAQLFERFDDDQAIGADGGLSRVREIVDDVGPQLATGALAAIGIAIVERELLPVVLLGVAATLLPKLVPGLGGAIRPVAKGVIRAGYGAFAIAQQAMAEASEQVQDLMAEIEAEQQRERGRTTQRATPRPAAA